VHSLEADRAVPHALQEGLLRLRTRRALPAALGILAEAREELLAAKGRPGGAEDIACRGHVENEAAAI